MTYIDDLANRIEREVPRDLLPDGDTGQLFRLYALLALVKGGRVTAQDVHDAWAVWMQERQPTHRSLKPFNQLDPRAQASDEPFVEAIRTVAGQLDGSADVT